MARRLGPSVRGTGPRNFPKTSPASVPVRRPRPSAAATPRVRPALASAGVGPPPGGAAGGIAKATSSMAAAPNKTINKPKTGPPKRGLGRPTADMPSRI